MSFTIAMVLLRDHAMPDVDAVVAHMASQWPDLPPATDLEPGEDGVALSFGELNIVATVMPAPIPPSDIDEPCAASWMWPDAAQVLADHRAHLIVVAQDVDDDPVERSKVLTQFIASLLATCPDAIGVLWSNAMLILPPPLFCEFATEFLPESLPLYLWIDLRAGRTDSGKMAGFTRGLEALGHMEFETEDSPEAPGELRQRFIGLAAYVLENGPVIQDGDTVGDSADHKIRVVYSPSAFGAEGQVMKLIHSAPPPRGRFR